ncbi:MAG TPA: hypothetical protein VF092_06805 [Longimicrobium sp.]
MSERTVPVRRIAAAVGAALVAGAAAVYVTRILRERARTAGGGRGPTAGRPLRLVRGGAGEG